MAIDTRTVVWDIEDAVVALNNGDGTFGTPVNVKGVVSLNLTFNVKTGEQNGDGNVYSVVSKATKASISFSFADQQQFAVLEVLRNKTKGNYGSTPNVRHMGIGSEPFPYFALCGQAYQDDGAETFNVLLPKVKITGDFSFAFADGAFIVPEFPCTAIADEYWTRSGKPQIGILWEYEDATALTIPPTNVPKVV